VDNEIVCGSCAGEESLFACSDCGREDHPYGFRRCARCILSERLTELLTDPTTGRVHTRLQPVFDELGGSERPQTGIWWLRKKPGIGPRLLGQMACGEVEISHDTFRALPSDRTHLYLRELLAAVGVLPPYETRIERIPPWLETKLAGLPSEHADLVRRFAHWRVLRQLRTTAAQGRLSKAITDRAREQISAAIRFLTFLDDHGLNAEVAVQADLENYQLATRATRPGLSTLSSEYAFIAWLRDSRINTRLKITSVTYGAPAVTVSDDQRWTHVDRLLHDDTLRDYTRLGGLFTLLFAQPLTRIVAMRTSQVTLAPGGQVNVTFNTVPIQMPAVVDELLQGHIQRRGQSLYASRDTGWLFPGGRPGRHLETENIRGQLVEIGIKPHESRKAALFGLAAQMPAPVLADLIGITDNNAADWAKLASRDWTGYIADRAR